MTPSISTAREGPVASARLAMAMGARRMRVPARWVCAAWPTRGLAATGESHAARRRHDHGPGSALGLEHRPGALLRAAVAGPGLLQPGRVPLVQGDRVVVGQLLAQ